MRAKWDMLLSELCGGTQDPDAGRLANNIEHEVRLIEEKAHRASVAYEALHMRQCDLEATLRQLTGSLTALRAIVDEQAEDDGLWFITRSAAEAYLQQELRKLHAAIEQVTDRPLNPHAEKDSDHGG